MPKLIITRSNEYMNRLRGIGVYVNDKEMGKIANGQVRDIELPAGDYSLKAKIDWCGSNEFQFHMTGSEAREVVLTSFGYSWYFIPISFTLLVATTVFQFVLKVPYAALISISVLLILGYYFTAGRNKYLVIKEKNKNAEAKKKLRSISNAQ